MMSLVIGDKVYLKYNKVYLKYNILNGISSEKCGFTTLSKIKRPNIGLVLLSYIQFSFREKLKLH